MSAGLDSIGVREKKKYGSAIGPFLKGKAAILRA